MHKDNETESDSVLSILFIVFFCAHAAWIIRNLRKTKQEEYYGIYKL